MDIAYLLWLQDARAAAGPAVEAFFVWLSDFSISAAVMLVPLAVYWCFDKRTGQLVMFSFGLGNFANQLLKNIVCAYRPWVRSALVHPAQGALAEATGYSFPSGHTQTATSVFGALGWAARRRWKWLAAVCFAFVALVAFSRNFLGVHTPQDVAVALAEGAACIALAGWLLRWVEGGPNRDVTVAVAGWVVCAAMLVFTTLKPYPMDYAGGVLLVDPVAMTTDCYKSAGMFAGMFAGWLAERRTMGFATDGLTWRVRVLRFAVGAAFTLVFYVALKGAFIALLGAWWGGFARSFCTFAGAVWLAPLVCAKLEARRKM